MIHNKPIVNANENVIFREAYQELDLKGNSQEYLLPFIPVARELIAKYSAHHEWKHFVNHREYIFKEYQLCLFIDNKMQRTRDKVIELVAWTLDVNPILLFNDADLPF